MMHESLRLKALSGLPSFEQTIAKSAVNGSLLRLRALVQIQELEPFESRFLPVFYHHLDPMKIPSEDVMDIEVLPDETLEIITRAFVSLDGLFDTVIPPPEAHSGLWQRVWPWIQFFSVHHSRVAGAPTEDIVQGRFFSVIASLTEELPRIASTSGVGILAAHAWVNYFRNPSVTSEKALRRLSAFLTASRYYDLEEFVDGAGGVDALAALVPQMVRYLLDSTDIPQGKAKNISGVLYFCTLSEKDTWLSALRSHEYVRATVSVLLFVEGLLEDQAAQVLQMYQELYRMAWNGCFEALLTISGYAHIVEAIDAGFLRFFVSLAGRHIDWTDSGMQTLLKLVLQPMTLYHPVLSALERSLPPLAQATSAPAFISSAQYAGWQEFTALVSERLEFKRHFDSGHYSHQRACDNLECGVILTKKDLKRCAGCEYQFYCSKECQTTDWQMGHRTTCQCTRPPDVWRADHLDGPVFLTGRDRSFLRAMIMRDYQRQKEHIFLTRLVRVPQHGERLATLFDYRNGPVRVDLCPILKGDAELTPVIRAARSGRRMHLCSVLIPNLADVARWDPPIRCSDSAVYDALYDLAHFVPPGTDTVADLSPAVRCIVTQLVNMHVSMEIV